jgi:16S rRNA processing protein RimM
MSRPAGAPDRLVLMGVFGAPQGVRGEVRVKSLTSDPKAIGAYGPLTDGRRARVIAFDSLRPLKDDMLVARIKGVTTREAAAGLTGVEIFARRDQLPPPGDDEFYYADLVGLDAVDKAGAPLGRIVSVMNYGGGDILEVAPGGGRETLLLPFTKQVAPALDFNAGRIVIEIPREVDVGRQRSGPSIRARAVMSVKAGIQTPGSDSTLGSQMRGNDKIGGD